MRSDCPFKMPDSSNVCSLEAVLYYAWEREVIRIVKERGSENRGPKIRCWLNTSSLIFTVVTTEFLGGLLNTLLSLLKSGMICGSPY